MKASRLVVSIVAFYGLTVPGLAAAGSTVLDFEGLADSTPITNQFGGQGVTFSGAVAISAGVTLNEIEFPPFSGSNVAYSDSGVVSGTFSVPVTHIAGHFTYEAPVTITGYDAAGSPVASAAAAFSKNYTSSGNAPNESLSLTFDAGIYSFSISSGGAPAAFAMDNFEFTQGAGTCPLDVDGSGRPPMVATDITYIARRLLGLPPVPASFRLLDPTIPSDAVIGANIDALGTALDVDQNGSVGVATDATYIARYLLGLPPVPASFRALDPTIPSDADITQRITALCP